MSDKALSPTEYISLEEAMKLNNKLSADQAWVFNSHKVKFENNSVKWPTDERERQKAKALAMHDASLKAKENPQAHPECWEVQPKSRFINQEMVNYLIDKRQFYYAPNRKGFERRLTLENVDY